MTRLQRLREAMVQRKLDGILISSAVNHRYLSRFHNPDGFLFITQADAYVIADFRYVEAAEKEADPAFTVVMPDGQTSFALVHTLAGTHGVKRVGYEDGAMTCRTFASLEEQVPGVKWVAVHDLVDALRTIKEPEEIEAIVSAQRIAEQAFAELIPTITGEMKEVELALELEYRMRRLGSEEKSFDTICVSGTASSLPHGVPRNRPLERGFLTIDFGATVNGYHSDMTRTLCIGRADDEMKRLYNTVLRAQTAALEMISEGVSNRAADKCARDIIEDAGYHGRFGHSLGHGVGLCIHEEPRLAPGVPATVKLLAGQVVTVEPGIYLPGAYGCRIEDMVAITPGGARNLTEAPKELIEL